jgi:2-amino-4-hydroxy-6-hydroxymethyldihydropteridine diphosphokinase
LEPAALLAATRSIEKQLGRTTGIRWGPRVIDIDILLFGDVVSSSTDLVLPHPRMMDRAFVLQPIVDIEPSLRHPVTGESLEEHLAKGEFERVRRRFEGESLLPEPVR